MSKISYKDAGVDIDAGNNFVERIKPHVKSTMIPGVLGGIGSFAGAFELPSGYKEPVILAGTDGVGTKLQVLYIHLEVQMHHQKTQYHQELQIGRAHV